VATWKFKSCPRCGGDVFLDKDQYSWCEHCVQCGHVRDLKSIDEFNKLSVENEKKPAAAGKGQPRG